MKRVWRVAGGMMCLFALFIFAGCQAAPVSNGNTAAPATPSPVASATPAPASGNASNLPVTLPVLDAMFADEKFAADLKSELQLTDEQIERLRKVAREETASLRETETGEHGGTTSAATARATQQIKSVLGDERAARFSEFVSARWSGGEDGTTAAAAGGGSGKPNSVPTDTRIVVNAPAYRMDVFENGQLVKTYKVGIGYPEFPLPTGQRKANTIIFNPTWTPPDEPWVESPTSKVKVGQKVEAGSPLNPLGPVKIPIGMPSLIHGGKSAAKLGSFASHGCVGLTNTQVQDVARMLAKIGGAQLTEEDMAAYAKNRKETKEVKLERPVPVELRYETIVVEDGKLYIYRDVYDRDSNTEANLRAVLTAFGVSFDSLSESERAQALDALRQMARDAKGNPADGTPDASPSATPEANNKNANKNANSKNANNQNDAESGKVTRTVKGQKEIVIQIAALRGKGYPAPVALDAGGAKQDAGGKKGKRS
ncbi:MAG TPA: L,D-transpeptidase family protein [Pyrinomonadaceae bacterium]|nr:L,D-transpeptidase family protein [Pyrinomonadaceae bacterium]